MKKAPRKLALHGETVRALATMDLTRVVGGLDTGDVQYRLVFDTGDKDCDTGVAVVATTACG